MNESESRVNGGEESRYCKVARELGHRASIGSRAKGTFEPNEKQTLRRRDGVPISILEDPEAEIEWAPSAAEAGRS